MVDTLERQALNVQLKNKLCHQWIMVQIEME